MMCLVDVYFVFDTVSFSVSDAGYMYIHSLKRQNMALRYSTAEFLSRRPHRMMKVADDGVSRVIRSYIENIKCCVRY
jgi:hypothetical protein